MEPEISTGVRAQLLTLSEGERKKAWSLLIELTEHPERVARFAHRSASDPALWTVRLTDRLRALLRIEEKRVKVLAIAPVDQLKPYLTANGKRVA